MTDEQLRAMARRVLGLLGIRMESSRRPATYVIGNVFEREIVEADAIESQAVAIMREEMDKCPKCGSNDTWACCCECGVYWGKDGIREPVKITAAIYDPADDPTQSFVATT